MSATFEEKTACLGRELRLRQNVYPKRVRQGKMKQTAADHELRVLASILADYHAGMVAQVDRPAAVRLWGLVGPLLGMVALEHVGEAVERVREFLELECPALPEGIWTELMNVARLHTAVRVMLSDIANAPLNEVCANAAQWHGVYYERMPKHWQARVDQALREREIDDLWARVAA